MENENKKNIQNLSNIINQLVEKYENLENENKKLKNELKKKIEYGKCFGCGGEHMYKKCPKRFKSKRNY